MKIKKIDFTLKRKILFTFLEENPFELALGFALVCYGSLALWSGLTAVPTSVSLLPIVLSFSYCILSIVGGAANIAGLIMRHRFLWSYGVRRLGLFVSASAWTGFAIGTLLTAPLTGRLTLFEFSLAGLILGCLFKARYIKRKEDATMAFLRENQNGTG